MNNEEPVVIKHEVERFDNTVSGEWIQKGPYIINKSAKLPYGVYIGMNKILIGIDQNGKPMLKDR